MILFCLYLGQFLSTCAVGESLKETEADEDEADHTNVSIFPASFQIVGSVSNVDANSKSFALEQYTVSLILTVGSCAEVV